MNVIRWYENGVCAAAAGLCALVIGLSEGASAQALPASIEVDENCNGNLITPFTPPGGVPLPCEFLPDPGPGGLPSVMTYNLLGPPGLVAGDVFLTEPGDGILDVIRFNPQEAGGSLVFYSDNVGGVDAGADTPTPPLAFYTNTVTIPEVGPEGNNGATYTPTAGQPGFVSGFVVTYFLHSDTTPAPEPATLALLALGLAGLGFARRRTLH